jgi:hypothetical protein
MYPLFLVIKSIVVFLFGASGVLFVSRGFGMPIPFLEYGALEAWNVFAGAALLTVSVAAAVFWHAPRVGKAREPDASGHFAMRAK